MIKSDLKEMTKGWFIGNFKPTLCNTEEVEVAVKEYRKGEGEKAHYHKIAKEFTVIVKGKVKMNDKICVKDDIIVIPPGESTDFSALEDTTTVVVKIPGAVNDKYSVEEK
jgi:quercetin dioxygenase-like cupin family protein